MRSEFPTRYRRTPGFSGVRRAPTGSGNKKCEAAQTIADHWSIAQNVGKFARS
ncbi:MAG: hypothetical protein LW731_10855 [Oxalobacteraceae bacterium]|nr:hypothetical protein [Oxalobacteraceae bacterium]